MRTENLLALAGASLMLVAATKAQAQYSVVHYFSTNITHGTNPRGDLTLVGSTFFGMTFNGGSNDYGVVFRINTDGSGYTNLHIFTDLNSGGPEDGGQPFGSLTLVGSILYGMTREGGDIGYGTIFKINTDGTGYSILHSFNGRMGDGRWPYDSLISAGSTLYGMTWSGGTNDYDGTVFKINTNGTGYTILHNFTGGSDGSNPSGNLTAYGSTLYGMTSRGGSNSRGTVFKINTDGSGYTNLHNFTYYDCPGCGSSPQGSLKLIGSTLYGMTYFDIYYAGIVFKMNTDGSSYTNLHGFGGQYSNDGADAFGSLTLVGSTLFGMTSGGGPGLYDGDGIIFSYSLPHYYLDWQMQYFGCTNCPEAAESADPDGDGQINQAEFLAGMNPTNSVSVFSIQSVLREGSDLRITWQTAGGRTNILQTSTTVGGSYTNVSPNVFIHGSGETTTNYLDIGAATNWPARFYRVRLVP